MTARGVASHALAGRLGAAAGSFYYELAGSRRRVARRNLALAFPADTERRLDSLARSSFRHFGRAVFESVSASRLPAESICDLLSFENWHEFVQAEKGDRGVIVLTAHLGAHEMVGPTVALYRGPMHMVARPFRYSPLERRVRAIRERFGNRSLLKRQAARGMLRALSQGERVAILIDQRVHPFQGVRVPFFGRSSWTSPLPAQISLRSGAPVLPIFAYSLSNGRYRIAVQPAIEPPPRSNSGSFDDDVVALTARYAQVTEAAIRRELVQWLWMHDRWRRH